MSVQVNFTTDPELKKAALMRAKKDGLTLKAILNTFLNAYSRGDVSLTFQINPEEYHSPAEERAYQEALKDLQNGNVISGEEFFAKVGL